MPKQIIALCGPDGSGKSTHAEMLAQELTVDGYDVTVVQPVYLPLKLLPGASRIATWGSPRQSRQGAETSSGRSHSLRRAALYLVTWVYALAAILLIRLTVRKEVVICDRYVYQFLYDVYGQRTHTLTKIVPEPDAGVYLSASFETLRAQMSSKYYQNVLQMYRTLDSQGTLAKISTERPIDAVNEEVVGYAKEHLTYRGATA